jgi:Uma2 family endonuclease
MNIPLTETRYSPEDLLNMADGDRFELVDGKLVERPMSTWSSYVAGEMFGQVRDFNRRKKVGWPLPEGTTYQCFPRDRNLVRKADCSFIRSERISPEQLQKPGHLRIAPDLAVEVVSPNDVVYDLDQKILDYLAAGVRLVWVINPEMHTVRIHRVDGSVSQLRETDELDGEDVLPGFRLPVRDLFTLAAEQPG